MQILSGAFRTKLRSSRSPPPTTGLLLDPGLRTARSPFIQRFNSALELSLHFHLLVPDGVYVAADADPDVRPRFVEIAPPTDEAISTLLDQIARRMIHLLRRRGRLGDDECDASAEKLRRTCSSPRLRLADETTPRTRRRRRPWGNERIGFVAKTAFDRTDFGLKWNQVLEAGGVLVGDHVDVELEVQAVKAAAAQAA